MKEATKNNLERYFKSDKPLEQYPKNFAQRLINCTLLLIGTNSRLRAWEISGKTEPFPKLEINTNGLPFKSSIHFSKRRHFEVWLTGDVPDRVAKKVRHALGGRRQTPTNHEESLFSPPSPNKAYLVQNGKGFELVKLTT